MTNFVIVAGPKNKLGDYVQDLDLGLDSPVYRVKSRHVAQICSVLNALAKSESNAKAEPALTHWLPNYVLVPTVSLIRVLAEHFPNSWAYMPQLKYLDVRVDMRSGDFTVVAKGLRAHKDLGIIITQNLLTEA